MHNSETVLFGDLADFVEDREDEGLEEGGVIIFAVFVEQIDNFHQGFSIFFGFAFDIVAEVHELCMCH